MGFSGKEKGAAQGGRAPPLPLVRIGLGGGAAPPLPSLSPLSPSRILFQLGKGGNPTPGGSRTPPFLVGVGEGKEGREEEKEKGGPPLSLSYSD